MSSEIFNSGTTVMIPTEEGWEYVMDDKRNPIVFKDEKEATDYLLSCGFEEARLKSIAFIQEISDGLY